MHVSGKHTLITGASSGIGKATAEIFARNGSNLLLIARNLERLERTASSIRKTYNVKTDILALDVQDTYAVEEQLTAYTQKYPLDIAILNHGTGQYGRFAYSPWEDIDPVLKTNISGTFAVAHAVLPQMIQSRSGALVFITSILDRRPIPNQAAYCASKTAVRALADVLRMELRQSGIQVSVVAPPKTNTNMFRAMRYSERQPISESVMVSPETIAEAALQAVLRNAREYTPGFKARIMTSLSSHFPRFTDWAVARTVAPPDSTP